MDKKGNYLRGIGIGLIIGWVTSLIAFGKGGSVYTEVIIFQVLLSIIFILIAYLVDSERKR